MRKVEKANKEQPLTSGSFVETQNNSFVETQNNSVKIKLPKLHLPTFNGIILNWQEFWDVYNTAVHEQDISKFSYLKGSLRNAATTAIYGISVTNDNYPVAINILHDKYGKKENIIEALYSRLQHLPMV